MNGHSYIERRLLSAGIRFRKDANAIVNCAEPEVLCQIADALDERTLRERADYWAFRLAPSFSGRERALCRLQYQWSVA